MNSRFNRGLDELERAPAAGTTQQILLIEILVANIRYRSVPKMTMFWSSESKGQPGSSGFVFVFD